MCLKYWVAAFFLGSAPVWAQDAALVIANENYRNASDIGGAGDSLDAAEALETAGFTLRSGSDLDLADMRDLLSRHYGDSEGHGRTVILLAGHVVHSGTQSWLVGSAADMPSLATIDGEGLPLSTVLQMAADRPGQAVVLIGTEAARIRLGRGLMPGLGTVDVPQGVTLFSGDAAEVAEFTSDVLVTSGLSLAEIAARAGDIEVSGFLGASAPFISEKAGPSVPSQDSAQQSERVFWDATRAANTVRSYETYLQRYPNGTYAAEAKAAIATLSDPVAQARAGEESLRLSRDQRRQIQRDLSILDIDPKGIDGLFGPGSRSAIAKWQRQNGDNATGFVTADQIAILAAQAERRAAQLEAEAAARKAEQDRQDRLFWDQTGVAGDEAGLRAYLKRYPDGLFAELAQDRLKVFDDAIRLQAEAADRAAWDEATRLNSVAGYQNYLARYPQGAFAEEARRMIADQSESASERAEREAAERGEAALGLNGVTRSIIEQRLAALGLKPGQTDGVFDDDTRRAIRRYQQARGLPVTGFLSQQTVARILVDSL